MSSTKPVVLLTSVTGSLGQEIYQQLQRLPETGQLPYQIRVLSTGKSYNPTRAEEILRSVAAAQPPVDVVKLPSTDLNAAATIAAINQAFQGVSYLVLCVPTACLDAKAHPDTSEEATFRALLQHDVKSNIHHIKHLIYISTAGTRVDHPACVFRNHWYHEEAIKQLVMESGNKMHYTIVRPAPFHQDYHKYNLPSIQAQNIIMGCSGTGNDSRICGVDIRDVAAVVVKIMSDHASHNGKIYTLMSDPAYNHADAAAIISRVAGRTITYVDLPPAEYETMLMQFGMTKEWAEDVTRIDLSRRDGQLVKATPDLMQLLGRPPLTLEQCITASAALFSKVDPSVECGAGASTSAAQQQQQAAQSKSQGQVESKEGGIV